MTSFPDSTCPVAIALGSNIGDREANLRYAIERLTTRLEDVRVSAFIETEPQDVAPQPLFLNGALTGHSRVPARDVLDFLLTVERERGRARPYPGAPRTLDLDLILYGEHIITESGLTVPHPRFRQRQFVLQPLASIAADMVDPVTGKTIGELWEELRRKAEGGRR